MTDRLFEYWEIRWGIEQCRGRSSCQRLADLLYDGQPLCISCADLLLQRHVAIAEAPQLRDMLPELWEG